MRMNLIAIAVTACSVALPGAVQAQSAPKSDWTLTGNVSVVSDYRYRGISQTNRKPAIQGGFDLAHSSGFYVGNWNSSISWLSDASAFYVTESGGSGAGNVSSNIEMDFYAGYKGEVTKGLGFDVGALYYYYPGSYPSDFNSPNTGEIYGALTYGPVTGKVSYAVTDLFGAPSSKGSYYLDLSAGFDIGSGFMLNAHVGHQRVDSASFRTTKDASYTDWKLGISKDLAGLNFALDYIDTNAKGNAGQFYRNKFNKDLGKGTLVLTAKKTF
ncbi:MAG: hypothetical protein ING18_02665 [Burkholderiales bacterium]|nr:hypothetical protein [Burkholderiales bacterium]